MDLRWRNVRDTSPEARALGGDAQRPSRREARLNARWSYVRSALGGPPRYVCCTDELKASVILMIDYCVVEVRWRLKVVVLKVEKAAEKRQTGAGSLYLRYMVNERRRKGERSEALEAFIWKAQALVWDGSRGCCRTRPQPRRSTSRSCLQFSHLNGHTQAYLQTTFRQIVSHLHLHITSKPTKRHQPTG